MSSQFAPVSVAVIGCGRISKSHLDAMQAQPHLARVVVVADTDAARAQATAQRHGVRVSTTDVDAALAHPDVEAVLICTPNSLHTTHTLQALAAGKHVLLEKPMAENAADARRMADAAAAASRVLALGHTFRHSNAVRLMQDRFAEFGQLLALEVSQCVFWDGPQAPWWRDLTPEQGVILSLFAPHAIDFTQLVMRDDPLRVHVETARHQHGWQGEDEAMILLGYPGQRMASIHVSYNQRRVIDRKILSFDRGVLRVEDGEWLYWNDELLVSGDDDPAQLRRMGGRDLSAAFRTQFAEFARAVRGLPNRSVLHEEAWRQSQLLDRVRAAARASRATG